MVFIRTRGGRGSSAPFTYVPSLNDLVLSGALVAGVPSSGTILNATTGSTIASTVPGLTVNSTARTYSYNGTGAVGAVQGLTETLAGATFSPRNNVVTVVSASVAAFTSNPSISPGSGNVGATFSAIDGAMSNGGQVLGRRWLLNGTSIGTGTTVVPVVQGSLVLENTGTGNVVATSTAVTVSAGSSEPPEYWVIMNAHSQSLGDGRGERVPALDVERANIKQIDNRPGSATFGQIIDNVYPKLGPTVRPNNEVGPLHALAYKLSDIAPANVIILIVHCAVGGTSLVNTASNNYPGAPQHAVGRNLNEADIASVNATMAMVKAINPASKLVAEFNSQSETDATGALAAQFLTAKRAQIENSRSRMTGFATTPWIVASGLPEKLDADPAFAELDAILQTIVADTPNMHYVPLGYGFDSGDRTHPVRAGSYRQGQDAGDVALGKTVVNWDRGGISRQAAEGNTGTASLVFRAIRSNSVGALSVPVNIAGNYSPSDFPGGVVPTLSAEFVSGSLTANVTVNFAGDTEAEPNDTFTLTFAATGNVVVGPSATATGTVLNDDTASGGGVNLLQSPQAFDQWSLVGTTVTPDTTGTADTIVAAASGTAARSVSAPTAGAPQVQAGQVHTAAVRVKKTAGRHLQIFFSSSLGATSGTMWATFDTTNGTVGATAASNAAPSIVSDGDYWLCALTVTIGTTGPATVSIGAQLSPTATRNATYSGTAGMALFELDKAQLVVGTVPNASF